jgi:hypothetical protein
MDGARGPVSPIVVHFRLRGIEARWGCSAMPLGDAHGMRKVYDFPSSTPQVEEAHRNDEDKNDEERRKKLGDQATAERIAYNRKGGG